MNVPLTSDEIKWQMAYTHEAEYRKLNALKTISDVENSGLPVLDCTVPGNFELDLHKNGIVEEPFFGTNVLELQKFEDCHVWYFTEFHAQAVLKKLAQLGSIEQDAFLVFEGLDTYADIYLNGSLIASTDNMLVPHRIPLNGLLQPENELMVHIRPAVVVASKYQYSVNDHALKYNFESLYVRKAPHMYGWDIMPRIVSAGIWRPVCLEFKPRERIEEIYLQTTSITCDGGDAELLCNYSVKSESIPTQGYELTIEGKYNDSNSSNPGQSSRFSVSRKLTFSAGSFRFKVQNARLWWPEGRGEPNLYSVHISLLKNGKVLDTTTMNLGIRTVKLDHTSTTDEDGRGRFCFVVNGERVFAKGTNWVPADAFHSRDRDRIPRILEMAKDLRCHIIRCWGGNVYEDDLFYDLCDQYGIMVWQDFAMACGIYPQSEEFAHRISNEVEAVVKRLRQHPCIVLWAGDNECDQAFRSWSGISRNPNSNVLTRKAIPDVIRMHDPIRAYLPSSPFIDKEAFQKGEKYLPENHLWGPRNYFKSDYYKQALCHFASEIGYHGSPSVESIRKFISPDSLWPYKGNKEWLTHAVCPKLEEDSPYKYRIELMATQIRELFGFVPDNLEDFVAASQVSQAEAFKFFIEFFRSRKWRTSGIIWWNLMDGWPQFSDAVVDYYFDKKLAYHYIKLSQQHICIMVKEDENLQDTSGKTKRTLNELVVCNDTREGTDIDYEIMNIDNGQVLLKGRGYAAADSVVSLERLPLSTETMPAFYVIRWETEKGRGVNHYTAGIPKNGEKEEKELQRTFRRYLNWQNKYHRLSDG